MSDLICPFSATLVKNDFGCQYATQIIRRGGAEIACASPSDYAECRAIHHEIKSAALSFMGLEDDLLTLPHSVLVKIQFGGLLSLQSAVGTDAPRVENIASLITTVRKKYENYKVLPFDSINTAVDDYKISRRSRK